MKRGYIVLELWCRSCKKHRPFNRITRWQSPQKKVVRRVDGKFVVQPSPRPTPNIPENARLIRGTCMICGYAGQFVVTEKFWASGHNTIETLCCCGLPIQHTSVHLPVLKERAHVN